MKVRCEKRSGRDPQPGREGAGGRGIITVSKFSSFATQPILQTFANRRAGFAGWRMGGLFSLKVGEIGGW